MSDDVDDLRDKVRELEEQNSTLIGEVETYRNEAVGTTKAAAEAAKQREDELLKIKGENENLKLEKVKFEILSVFPEVDPALLSGNSKEELEANAKKLDEFRIKSQDKVKTQTEEELKKKWGALPAGNPGGNNFPGSRQEPEAERLSRERYEHSQNETDYLRWIAIKGGMLKQKPTQ